MSARLRKAYVTVGNPFECDSNTLGDPLSFALFVPPDPSDDEPLVVRTFTLAGRT
jgi:hypothetical protein